MLAAAGWSFAAGPAGAVNPPGVTRISPISEPAGTSVSFTIHGHGFDTAAGATTVSFGGTPAVSVYCGSPTTCTAVSPNLAVGPVDVVVTTDGTVLSPEVLTVTPWSPFPVIRLLPAARSKVIFSMGSVDVDYPALGGPGYDALTVRNTTGTTQTITNATVGSVTIDPGDSVTLALAAAPGPYVFLTSDTPTAATTIWARTPK
jgi:hypothetical protein